MDNKPHPKSEFPPMGEEIENVSISVLIITKNGYIDSAYYSFSKKEWITSSFRVAPDWFNFVWYYIPKYMKYQKLN